MPPHLTRRREITDQMNPCSTLDAPVISLSISLSVFTLHTRSKRIVPKQGRNIAEGKE